MSHDARKIFVDTTTSPHRGITCDDINAVVGSSGMDIGQVITDGSSRGLIKKWAKFKPYRNSLRATSATARTEANYGLGIASATELGNPGNASSFLGMLVREQLLWEYLAPRGNSSTIHEWFRHLDFDGYINDAVCPISGGPGASVPIDNYGNAVLTWEIESDLDAGNLRLSDIVVSNTALSGMYLGILLYQSANSWHVVTSNTTLGSSGVSIPLTNAASLAGTWLMYPFFSSVQIPLGSQLQTGLYVAAGWDDAFQEIAFLPSSGYIRIVVNGIWNSAHTAISISFDAYSSFTTAKTISGCSLYLRKNHWGDGVPASASSLASVSVPTFTIPAASGTTDGHYYGSGLTVSYNALTDPDVIDEGYDAFAWWLFVSLSAEGFQNTYWQVEEPDDFDPDLPTP